jgi:DNA repair exonuclease SbcCD ATPase subunit
VETVRLLDIRISGFRSFLDEAKITFPPSGLVCLHGLDTRTGGSNGSGKSSILEAIYWILGINTLPATELKNYIAKSMEGCLSLLVGSQTWEVTRTSTKLSLKIDGVEFEGMKNIIQDKIFEKIGDPEIFETLSYRRQSDLGKFFYTQDTKLKQFFSKCIPELDALDEISEKASDTAKQIQNEIDKQSSVLEAISKDPSLFKTNLFDIGGSKKELSDLQKELSIIRDKDQLAFLSATERGDFELSLKDKDRLLLKIGMLKDKLAESVRSLDNDSDIVSINVNAELKQKERNGLNLKEFESASLAQIQLLEESLSKINRNEQDRASKQLQITSNISTLKEVNSQISHLREMKCPTCLRDWLESSSRLDKLLENKQLLMSNMMKLDSEIKACPNFEEQRLAIKSNISNINQQLSEIRARDQLLSSDIRNLLSQIPALKNQKLKDIDTELKHAQSLFEITHRKVLDNENTALQMKNGEIQNLRHKISTLEVGIKAYEDAEKMVQQKRGDIQSLADKIDNLRANYELESSISKILGKKGVLGLYFNELMKEIESGANRMISDIPNASDIALSIDTSSETKTGSTKNQITISLTKSGNDISFRSLSGGQKSALSLCVDLAMMNALKRRTNIKTGWIALDEAMDGMDVASKEAALTLIKNETNDSLILMIDHSTEIKELFDSIINIEFDGKTSKVVL